MIVTAVSKRNASYGVRTTFWNGTAIYWNCLSGILQLIRNFLPFLNLNSMGFEVNLHSGASRKLASSTHTGEEREDMRRLCSWRAIITGRRLSTIRKPTRGQMVKELAGVAGEAPEY